MEITFFILWSIWKFHEMDIFLQNEYDMMSYKICKYNVTVNRYKKKKYILNKSYFKTYS